jgi:hypothetical protein
MEVKSIESIWYDARRTLPEDDGSEILCLEDGGYARIGKGKLLNGTTKWAYVKDLEKAYKIEL